MVGTTGFEPATSRTPSVRATRLRYVPTGGSYCSSSAAADEGFLQIGRKSPRLILRIPQAQRRGLQQSQNTASVSLGFEDRQQGAQRVAQVEQGLAVQRRKLR